MPLCDCLSSLEHEITKKKDFLNTKTLNPIIDHYNIELAFDCSYLIVPIY